MPETTEFRTSVALTLQGKAYGPEVMENRWREVERTLLKMFGPGNYEITSKPEWEERLVEDITEQPEI